MSISEIPATPASVNDDVNRGGGADPLAWGPAIKFVSVAGIVLGALWLAAGLWLPLAIYARSPDPMAPVYVEVPLLGTWRWGAALCSAAAGFLALFGGVDGLRRRPITRRLLRFAVLVAVVRWLVDVGLWGGWCLGAFAIGAAPQPFHGYVRNPYGGYDPFPLHALQAEVIAALIVSTIVTLAWTILVLTIVRPRRAGVASVGSAATEPVGTVGRSLEQRGTVPAPLSYRSSGTRAIETPVQAPPVLIRALFWVGIVLAILNVTTDVGTVVQLGPQLIGRRPLATAGRIASSGQSGMWLSLHLVHAAAAFVVLIGCVLGLARRINIGRAVLFIGLAAALLIDLAVLRQGLVSTLFPLLQGSSRWPILPAAIATFLRGQVFAVICFVALARAPMSTLAES